ncbi:MAG: ABC transporter substrate-binding protein [Desulfomonilaceae bacterium]
MTQHNHEFQEPDDASAVQGFPHLRAPLTMFSRRDFLVSTALTSALALIGAVSWAEKPQEKPRIGFIYPESGTTGVEARSFMAGFRMSFDKENQCPVDVLTKSYKDNTDEMTGAVDEWTKEGKILLVVLFGDAEGTAKAIRSCAQAKSLLFVTNRSVRLVSGEVCGPNVFRVSPNNYVLSEPLAPWAIQNVGTKVFVTGTNDVDCNEQCDFFAFGFERSGGGFADRLMCDGAVESVNSIISAIKNSEADFVFACFGDENAGNFLKAFHFQDPKSRKKIIGPGSLTSLVVKEKFGSDVIMNIPTLTTVINPDSIISKAGGASGTGPFSVDRISEGYNLGQVVKMLAKSNLLASEDFGAVSKAILTSKYDGLNGAFTFDKNQDIVSDSWVTKWEISSGGGPSQKILAALGASASLDFGCGKVGFPNRHEAESMDDEAVWEENSR